MKRRDFLRRLLERPAGQHLPPEPPPPPLPPPPEDLPEAFYAAAEANGSRVVRGDGAKLLNALQAAVGREGVLAAPSKETQPWLEGLCLLAAGSNPFAAQWGFAVAQAGLARTGSVCFVRSKDTPLLPSLVPPHLAVLLPAERLVWDLGDFLATQAGGGGSIAIVSGPSRSADIGSELSVGVHGPGEVLVLLWQEG